MKSDADNVEFAHGGVAADVLVSLRRIIRVIELHSRQLVSRFGLTGPQLVVLKALAQQGQVPVSKLAKSVQLSQATVTGIINRLGQRDLVARHRDDVDRRRVIVELTPTGREMLSNSPSLLHEGFIRQFENLEDWEQTQILATLQRLVSMMEAHDVDASPLLATGPVNAGADETAAFLSDLPGADDPPSVDATPDDAS
jgi:DNA-binding MarR family transcriptional regulator